MQEWRLQLSCHFNCNYIYLERSVLPDVRGGVIHETTSVACCQMSFNICLCLPSLSITGIMCRGHVISLR